MFIKEITFKLRNDFSAIMKCQFCGHEQKNESGYDDSYYHAKVIPGIKCDKCGFNTNDTMIAALLGKNTIKDKVTE